jgi:hypothetical protein
MLSLDVEAPVAETRAAGLADDVRGRGRAQDRGAMDVTDEGIASLDDSGERNDPVDHPSSIADASFSSGGADNTCVFAQAVRESC